MKYSTDSVPRKTRFKVTPASARYNRAMESDQLNLIENALHDLAARSAELRRYL
jgi:hypothetical protein